jgi:hypothetical protein
MFFPHGLYYNNNTVEPLSLLLLLFFFFYNKSTWRYLCDVHLIIWEISLKLMKKEKEKHA